jgi:chromosomal replication initiator protein
MRRPAFPVEPEIVLSLETIVREVGRFYRLRPEALLSKTQKSEIAHARHVAWYLARRLLFEMSAETIGDFFHRDHSTVLGAVKKIKEQRVANRRLHERLEALERCLVAREQPGPRPALPEMSVEDEEGSAA